MSGTAWAPQTRPPRMRATYNRHHGIEYVLGFSDVHADCLAGVFVKRKRVIELAAAFRRLRTCYPGQHLYIVMDNLPHVHDHPRLLRLLTRLHMTPLFTPTNASWLNLIEPQFGVMKRAALNGTDDPSHQVRRHRLVRYIRHRNRTHGQGTHPLNRMLTVQDIKLERH